jgi:hypothetical protein
VALQTSGAIGLDQIRTEFGIAGAVNLSQLYRGGAFVPSSRTVNTTVRDPTTGSYYQVPPATIGPMAALRFDPVRIEEAWTVVAWSAEFGVTQWFRLWYTDGNGNTAGGEFIETPGQVLQINSGGRTWFRGPFQATEQSKSGQDIFYYRLFFTSGGTSTININQSVPSSGLIGLSNFYGAEQA